MFDSSSVRKQFPVFDTRPDLVYLDNASTTQKPRAVLDAMNTWYETQVSNVHRGMHTLAEDATNAYENSRVTVQKFLNASHADEVIFTKSCTESINLVARTWAHQNLHKGDTIVLSILEHHSNIVPWLQLKQEKGINVEWIGIEDNGGVKMDELDALLAQKNVKFVSITGQSNVLGTRPDVKTVIQKAHAAGAKVLVDAAQLIAHHKVDVQELDCDFLAFSGHKLYGPFGIGVLYGKEDLLKEMPPFLGGGMMIHEVTVKGFTAADAPAKFEAGTPPIAEAIGLQAAMNWLSQFDWQDIERHEAMLIASAHTELSTINGLHILSSHNASGCLSFTIDGIHPHDLTDALGKKNIALRAGHHCCQPLHEHLKINATSRLSVGIYNTLDEVRTLAQAVQSLIRSS